MHAIKLKLRYKPEHRTMDDQIILYMRYIAKEIEYNITQSFLNYKAEFKKN